ncbi:hypothetical protein NLX86_09520 [Streptomyces sp. A3M-1-3]|uniref:hypothetical protein n=1 Tax=Streptomyces sp. A3M-1-3 TaxID=2962044 RepID=UPI0020B6A326|nr:hypothetical protein [Streptomyces sp. A3M-1-3]MCP3818345.1 hypothetical protein [Streptomyces sp. A3M-1-3]
MPRPLRLLPALLLPLVLTACGTEPSSVDRTELEARAEAKQSAIELIHVTEVPGYEVAKMSVGVIGHDGFQATYTSKTGEMITLSVDRGKLDGKSCSGCERDGENWYRTSAGTHEYARSEGAATDAHVVRLSADSTRVDRETLRRAAESAHVADDEELDAVLPDSAGTDPGGQPVERGDLPPVGDGAPNNEVGASG